MFQAALAMEDSDMIRALSEHGVDVNRNPNSANAEYPPLFSSCERGKVPLVRVLLECGANVNLFAAGGALAPLHLMALKKVLIHLLHFN